MSKVQKFTDDFILMAEAGFIAINQSDEDAAIKLFAAAELLDPSNPLPRLGMGYLNLCQLKLKQAATIFEKILSEDPSNEMAKTLLGLTLSLNPTELAKGEKTLEESIQKNQDPMIKNLAKSALDFVEKFIKKAPSPAEPKTPHKK